MCNSPPRHPEPERSEGEGSPVGWHVQNKNNENNVTNESEPTSSYSESATQDASNTTPAESANSEPAQAVTSSSWHCVDATSYDHNAYNDNKCTNGSETRYVSDSQAVSLDPNYSPGKAGAAYYNNQ